MMDLNSYIAQEAKSKGICEEWGELLKTASKEQMMEMYVKGIDFCLKENFPSNIDLQNLVGPSELAKYGVFIDAPLNATNVPFLVILGACSGKVNWSVFSVGQLFVKHTSNIKVTVNDSAFLVIDAFDSVTIDIACNENAKVLVNIYGQAKVTQSGNGIIKIVNKNKSAY